MNTEISTPYDVFSDIRPVNWAYLDDLDTTHHTKVQMAIDAARQWARRHNQGEDPAPWLILMGPNGTAKTHIARSIWSAFYSTVDYDGVDIRRPNGRFLQAADLVTDLGPQPENEGGSAVSRIIGSAPVVIIDDLGAEGIIPFVAKEAQDHERHVRYFRFIDFCYINNIPGVITTNLKLNELANHVGPRAWDRLMQMAPAGQIVNLDGVPSWRVKAGGR